MKVKQYFLFDVQSARVVDEVVQSAVSAGEDNDAIVVTGNEEVIVAAHCRYVNVTHLAVTQDGVQRVRRRLSLAVVCTGSV